MPQWFKGAAIGGFVAWILGLLLVWIVGFSQESLSVIKLFLLGLISGGLISHVYDKSKKIKKPLKETYAWEGAVIGGIIFLIPSVANTFGLLSGILAYPFLFIIRLIGFPESIVLIIFWAIHILFWGAVGYTIGYLTKKGNC